jgi:hypothetical protein
MNRSVGLSVGVGARFLGSSEPVQLCWVGLKGCRVWGPPTGSICRAYVDCHGKRMYRVGRVFPCRVYIDLNCRDSQI